MYSSVFQDGSVGRNGSQHLLHAKNFDALVNIDGILLATPSNETCFHVIYALDKLTFEIVIELLNELEFETDNSLLISLRNTIFSFLEENARDNLHIDVTEFQQEEDESAEIPQQQDDDQYWDDYR